MQWRHLRLVRAWGAAGLVIGSSLLAASDAAAQLKLEAPSGSEVTARPATIETQTVDILKARKDGDLDVVVRGQGQDRVKMTLHNKSTKRLNVVVPPGMVAASNVAQRGGGGGGGGGLQNMGLGAVNNRPGGFGRFQPVEAVAGLRSVPAVADAISPDSVAVPVGETIELTIPAVCLNFGLATPTPRDTFELKDVTEYTPDPRVRKALRSLAAYGTSQGVAQASMWRVCNDVPFETMAAKGGKIMNSHEIALASRFVEALDSSASSDLVDPSYFTEGRVFVQIAGDKASAGAAQRISEQLEGLRLLGLPARVVGSDELPTATAPALFLKVTLDGSAKGEVRGRILASSCQQADDWAPLGKTMFSYEGSIESIDGATLAKSIDRAVSLAFVSVKPARRAVNSTTLKVENRLPFTIAGLTVKTGSSIGSPSVPFEGLGIGPVRSSTVQIQAASAVVESVQFNGL
jgi:hypothetical protein